MKFHDVSTQNNIFLAPMAGYTDAAFRAICAEMGASLCYSEMISAKGLNYNNANTATLTQVFPPEKVSACQLFGSDCVDMARAVKNPLLDRFDIIDINMGCPVPKVTKCGEGSALMADIKKASKIISAVAAATPRPVTVKFRRGYKGVDNAVDFAKMCEDSGAAAVAVHPRFSEAMYSGTADYETIKRVVAALKIPVIASGDINSLDSYIKAAEIADAVMIGRAAVGNPWIFSRLIRGEPVPKAIATEEVKKTILRQIGYLVPAFSERYILSAMRPHILAYLKTAGIKGEKRKEIFADICKFTNIEKFQDFIENL